MKLHINVPDIELRAFCQKWKVKELAFFGSVLREDFRSDSDIDLLISFEPIFRPGFLEMDEMEQELAKLFERQVDLIEKAAIERSENYIRRRDILASAEIYYAA